MCARIEGVAGEEAAILAVVLHEAQAAGPLGAEARAST